jgi:hypothetical protein
MRLRLMVLQSRPRLQLARWRVGPMLLVGKSGGMHAWVDRTGRGGTMVCTIKRSRTANILLSTLCILIRRLRDSPRWCRSARHGGVGRRAECASRVLSDVTLLARVVCRRVMPGLVQQLSALVGALLFCKCAMFIRNGARALRASNSTAYVFSRFQFLRWLYFMRCGPQFSTARHYRTKTSS